MGRRIAHHVEPVDRRRYAVISFAVDGMPVTKGSWRVIRGKLIPDNPGEPAWAQPVGWACRAKLRNRLEPDRARYRVTLEFTLTPPPNKGRTNRRDIDKLARSILDALTSIIWLDDEQVDELHVTKCTGPAPGVVVTIERLSPAP